MFHFAQDRSRKAEAFTLIELLVVITIIVLLLALLTPALDKAIYQAELAVCSTNLNGMIDGVTTYAAESRRYYPHRPGVTSPGWYPQNAVQHGQTNTQFDDRKTIRRAFGLNGFLNDPFVQEIEIEDAGDNVWIWTSYNLWFGFKFKGQGNTWDQGMLRLGDRLTYTARGTLASPLKFNLIASDIDRVSTHNNFHISSHPDSDGQFTSVALEESDPGAVNTVANQDVDFRSSLTRWQGNDRGDLDLNYAWADGSVSRVDRVSLEASNPDVDGRMERVGVNTASSNYATAWDHLPLR